VRGLSACSYSVFSMVISRMTVQPLVIKASTIYAGKRAIISEGNKRYKIYLPMSFNDLWTKLKGRKVSVYLVVEEGDE
jgi:hypothetical protein